MNFSISDKAVYYLSLSVSFVLILIMFSSLNDTNTYEFFNSDALFFPNLYKDIVVDGSPFLGWSLGTTPNYFPTGLTYFIFAFITSDLILAHFLNGIVQYLAILILFFLILKQLTPHYFLKASLANLLLALFPFYTIISNNFLFTSFLVLPYHTGVHIITLLNLLLLIVYLKNQKIYYLVAYSILTFLVVFSNYLYIVSSIAFVVSLFFIPKTLLRTKLLIATSTIASSLFGILALRMLVGHSELSYSNQLVLSVQGAVSSSILLLNDFANIILSFNTISIVLLLSISVYIVLVFFGVTSFKKEKLDSGFYFPLFFTLLYVTGLFLASGFTSKYIGLDCVRYYIATTYILMCAFAFVSYSFIKSVVIKRGIVYMGIASIFMVVLLTSSFNSLSKGLKNKFNYYPYVVSKIDSLAVAHNLKYGLSGYWDATFIRFFSKNNLRVYSVFDDFNPLLHNANKNWYLPNNNTDYKNPEFSFIVEGIGLSSKAIESFFNNKFEVIRVGNKNVYLVPEFTFDSILLRPNMPSVVLEDIICTMEFITEDEQFILSEDGKYRFRNNVVVPQKGINGSNALHLRGYENFFLDFNVDSVGVSHMYDITVYVKNYRRNVFIVGSIKSPNDFYVTNRIAEKIDKDWTRLRLVYNVPKHLADQRMSINIYKHDSSEAFIDNFNIRISEVQPH